jgi:hypothetical protein
MYKCDNCGKSTRPGEKIRRVVTSVRSKTYPARTYKRKGHSITDPGGFGMETINEVKTCVGCQFMIALWGNEDDDRKLCILPSHLRRKGWRGRESWYLRLMPQHR